MKLPLGLPRQKKEKKEYFLALLLRDEKATAVIFEEIMGKIHVIGEHEEHFSTSIETISDDEWLDTLDKTISQAESSLPESIQTQKTVFGVKEAWVEESRIKKEYLAKLKKLGEALGLTPIGFLVVPEAIAHLLSKEEGAPISAILIELGKRTVTASLIRAGRMVETKTTDVTESHVKATDALLQEFTSVEVLPSRIVIFNEQEDEHIVQKFLHHTWSKQLPFLHVPQVTALPRSFDARAVLFGAATQMGFDMTVSQAEHMRLPQMSKAPVVPEETDDEELAPEEKEETSKNTTFVSDNITVPDTEEEETEELLPGFVKEKDIAKEKPTHAIVEKDDQTYEEQPIRGTEKKTDKKGLTALPVALFAPLKMVISAFPSGIGKHMRLPGFAGTSRKIIFIPPIIIGMLLLVVLLYIFGVKAEVTVQVTPRVIDQSETVQFTTKGSSDIAQNILPADIVAVDENGSVSTSVTGKKEVGDKAKGAVTLYSRLPQDKTFPSGAVITSSNGIRFVLDESVKVASSSADASAGAATAKVNVTASAIGKEANLPSGTKFSFNEYNTTDMVAKNDNAFAGGSKKEITVVSQKDIDKLLADLPKNLEDKATGEMKKQVTGNSDLLPVTIDATVTKKEFDKKVGDEASTLTLKGTVSFEGISYKKSVLTDFAKEKLKDKITNQELMKDGISVNVSGVDQKGEDITSSLTLKARLLPKLENEKIAQEVSGKTFEEARKTLTEIPQVAGVSIKLIPPIPLLPQLLPRMAKNISIRIEQ